MNIWGIVFHGLCIYCHFVRTCLVRPCKFPAAWFHLVHPTGTNQTNITPLIPLQLLWKTISVPAIIDSGACNSFVESTFILQHELPFCAKKQGFLVLLANGSGIKSGSDFSRDSSHFLLYFIKAPISYTLLRCMSLHHPCFQLSLACSG